MDFVPGPFDRINDTTISLMAAKNNSVTLKDDLEALKNLGINGDMEREDLQRAITEKLDDMLRGIEITEDDKKAPARSLTQALVYVKLLEQNLLNEVERDCLQPFKAGMVSAVLGQLKATISKIKMSPDMREEKYVSVRGYIDSVVAQIEDLLGMVDQYTEIERGG